MAKRFVHFRRDFGPLLFTETPKSFRFHGCCWATWSFSPFHRFSYRRKSEDGWGYFTALKQFFSRSFEALVMYFWSLSCRMNQPWLILNVLAEREGSLLIASFTRRLILGLTSWFIQKMHEGGKVGSETPYLPREVVTSTELLTSEKVNWFAAQTYLNNVTKFWHMLSVTNHKFKCQNISRIHLFELNLRCGFYCFSFAQTS